MLGVPGLLNAYRAGNVTLANAPGTGVADDKAVYATCPEMIRYYLGEEPILGNVPTYLGVDEDDRSYMLEHLDELVVKAVDGSGGYGMLIGPVSSAEERERVPPPDRGRPARLHRAADARPEPHADLPRRAAPGARRPAARSCSRAAITSVVPGGLTRVALRDGLAGRQLLAGRRQQGHLGAALLMLSRVAESLYWMARYIERAEDTSRAAARRTSTACSTPTCPTAGAAGASWCCCSAATSVFREHFDDYSAQAVTEFMLWHPANPDAVTACVGARAGERARRARADLERDVGAPQPAAPARLAHAAGGRARLAARVLRAHPRGSHAFQGVDEGDAAARRGVRVPPARRAPRAGRHDDAPARGQGARPAAGRAGVGRRTTRSRACCARAAPSRPSASRAATSCAPRASSRSCCSSAACRAR